MASTYKDFVDGRFCNEATCLNEVSIFKWREQILGAYDAHVLPEDVRNVTNLYANMEANDVPEDAKKAYEVYGNLAKALIENS